MTDGIQELVERHRAWYEVLPYYIVQVEARGTSKRIQAGFDIEVYGDKPSQEQHPGPDYVHGYAALKELIERTLPELAASCSLEIIPFLSTVIFDPRSHFQELGMFRIRIMHKDLQPAGESEEAALKRVKERLQELGLRQR